MLQGSRTLLIQCGGKGKRYWDPFCAKGKLKRALLLDSDASLPPTEVHAVRQRRLQCVLANAIAGATYSKKTIISLMSHTGVEGSDTFSQDFRMYCRIVLDGKPEEVPLSAHFSMPSGTKSCTMQQGFSIFSCVAWHA